MQLSQERRDNERWQTFAALSTIDYDGELARLEQLRYKDSGTWFVEHPSYLTWKESCESSGLCCHGIPGSGKSVLTSKVINDLREKTNRNATCVLYYFCEYSNPQSLQPTNVYRTLLKQIYNMGSLYDEVVDKIVKAFKTSLHGPPERVLATLFLLAIKSLDIGQCISKFFSGFSELFRSC